MDPNLFHLDWNRVFEALAAVVIISFMAERALSVLFENEFLMEKVWDRAKGLKELVAFALALTVCFVWDLDLISMVVLADTTSVTGKFITAGVIAGGAKGSVTLFRDVLGFRSKAYDQRNPRDARRTPE